MKINGSSLQLLLVLILICTLGNPSFAQKTKPLSKKEMTERLLALETENKQLSEALSTAELKIAKLQDNLNKANARLNVSPNNGSSLPSVINPSRIESLEVPLIDPATAANMSFEEQTFDFGTIEEGEKMEHYFQFTNNSQNPLTISHARGSCGCTVPEWPREIIAPGETGKIKVKFDSKGKKGKQSKTITISANTIPTNTILNIKADVIKLDDK